MSTHVHSLLPKLSILSIALAALPAWSGAAEEAVLGEVKVNATRSQAQEMRRNASAGKIIFDRAELETLDASSMSELLSKLPGTSMSADMDSGPRGRPRGPDRNMPQILVDGQPLPGGSRNPMAALRLPVELIERVEIIRNSTAEFPVLGPGGVINLILRDVPDKKTASAKAGLSAIDGRAGYRLEGQYGEPDGGDFGYLLSGAFNSRPVTGNQTMNAQLYTGGAPSGTLSEHATQTGEDRNITLSPRFSWNLGGGQKISLMPFLTHTETGRSGTVDRLTSGVASRDRFDEDNGRTSARVSAEWKESGQGGSETSARVMLQAERDHLSRLTSKYDAANALTSAQQENTLREERDAMLELRRKTLLGESHLVTAAFEARSRATDDSLWRSTGASELARLNERRQVLWAQDEWQLTERQVLTPGLRYQRLGTEVEDSQGSHVSRQTRQVDPSLHYLFQVTDAWNLRASVARNTKAPYTRDLSPLVRQVTGTNSAASPDRGGNADLMPERLTSIEFGVEHFLDERAGTIGLSVFNRDIDDYTQRLIKEEGGRWVERPYNVGKARLQGFVLDYKSKMGVIGLPDLTLRGNLAYTHTQMLEKVDGLGAGDGPRKSVNLGWDYDWSAYRLTFGGNFSYTSALDRESSATIRQYQGQRRQLDLYTLVKLDRQLALRFSAQNVTKEGRDNSLTQYDSSGLLARSEVDTIRGVATYAMTLEAKW